jgi:hypothetical protein
VSRRTEFIRKLAEFLVGDQALMSIRLEAGDRDAKRWAGLRIATPLFGYQTVDEAEKVLTEFLTGESGVREV